MATVGLCLADGSPIAVTVVRDCAGTATSEGWISLTTGAWSAGAPPVGTIACGDSRSITTNGTFCDVLEDGTVAGLVLVEYQYAADGSIDSVRLVDAVTGATYTPVGEVTTCPAGVEQPERDMVQLCDIADDESGTTSAVPFLRDYARNETGAITGHADYDLDGLPYAPAGTVGVCPQESSCRDCQTLALCDAPATTAPAPLTATGTGALSGTAANNIGWHTSSGTNSGAPNWFSLSLFPVASGGPFILTLDRPSSVTWAARVGVSGAATGRLVMPPGSELVELAPLHTYDPLTRTLTPAPGAGVATANGESRFAHPGPVTSLTIASDGTGSINVTQRQVGDFVLTPVTVPFLRTTCRDCVGQVLESTDTLLDGATPYTPAGTVGVCHPPTAEPCASTVTTLRLCDLNPEVEPDSEGRRCAVPFLRHLVHDCTGALAETRDTATDGTTPYTPVQVVDCGSGGVPAMIEVPWEVVGIEPDPGSAAGRGFLFSLSPVDDPATVGVVKVTTTSTANTACASTPPNYAFANPTTYTFVPDQVLQDAATYVRCDLRDFDTFEPVGSLTPPPTRLGGTAYWDGNTVRPTVNDGTGEMYYDGPPAQWSYRVGNTGGGLSCSALSFAAVSLRPEGCCAPCGGSSGGDGTGRTVQEVCVIATAAPTDVMTWTRVIEDGGAVIYYLDQTGARHDATLPAGHQVVACPAEETEGCTSCETITLCDVQPDESPGEPLINFTALRLAELEDGPTSGTLANGVGFTVSCGDWLEPQGHYTIYPVGGSGTPACDQVWTFDQPVYLRLGLRGLNVAPRECLAYEADTTWSVEFLHPNHRAGADPDSICGLGSATDESIIRTDGPVTELTIRATTNAGAGRGLGLLQAGLLANPQPEPGSVTPFLRTVCRNCQGETTSTTDTTLAGAPYTPSGLVTVCDTGSGGGTGGDECRSSTSLLLCERTAGEGTSRGDLTATPVDDATLFNGWSGYGGATNSTWCQVNGTPATLWTGGSATFGPGGACANGAGSMHEVVAAALSADTGDCAEVTVTVSVRVELLGPAAGVAGDGVVALWNTATGEQLATKRVQSGAPVGHVETVSLSASLPGAEVAAGHLAVSVDLETEHGGAKSWTADSFTATYEATGCVAVSEFLRHVVTDCDGQVLAQTDTDLDGQPITVTGDVGQCTSAGGSEATPGRDVEVLQLCDTPEDGDPVPFLRHLVYTDGTVPPTVLDTELDGVTPYMLAGDAVDCAAAEPCRDSSSTLLCDTSAADLITVFDPANRPDDDGWEVVSFTGYHADAPPEAPLPYPARYGTPYGYPALGARADQYGGYGGGSWQGYDSAPVRWVIRKEFTAPEDGVAVAQSVGFRGDGGARVRINGVDAGMYGQWNQPATSGTAEIPVTAGANVVEIEVRDVNGINNVVGRLDVALPKTVQFLRRQVTDCETGEVVSTTDTTLGGQPYEVTGEVGQCTTAGGECCEQPPPELRVDVESDVMCIRTQDGEVTGQVLVERVYDDQSGDRVVQRLADPTSGEPVELPEGAELVLCQEPPCPRAFSTECVGVVTRTEASYDNTSLVGGLPGKCGSIQGPAGQFPCQPTGPLTITSWIINGEDVFPEDSPGRQFTGGACGPGTDAAHGMHRNWAEALTNLDVTSDRWVVDSAPGCAFFIRSEGGEATVYGAMTIRDQAGQEWTLGPVQGCEEIQYTRVYTQECDGSVSLAWLDAQGEAVPAPEGDFVPCGTGCGAGGSGGLDAEVIALCDTADDGTTVQFLRHITYGTAGQVSVVVDTALDGFSPYTPSGTVGVCQPEQGGQDIELVPMCIIDNINGQSIGDVFAEVRYASDTGERTGVTYVDPLTWGPVSLPGGSHIGLCPEAEPTECPAQSVVQECRWDDTDGDGIADASYVELIGVGCDGALTPLGTYTEGLAEAYVPVSPVAAPEEEPPVATFVEAHRVELAAGQAWDASTVTLLQSVTATAHGGAGQITTSGGTSTLFEGESVSWSVVRDSDAALSGPLTITGGPGVVTVSYTRTTAA
ncbi:hypothetical protein ACIP5N_32135 [Streptomyces sp. NPDC088768]|uniref:hypothetical protein n=1 Tax=Streptomyces sp. NPDC088768 TaxID=3365894 RepID=UPI00380DD81F